MGMNRSAANIETVPLRFSCKECPSRKVCLSMELGAHDPAAPERIIRRRLRRKGETLYRAGEPLRALHAVQGGCIRTSMSTCDGEVQVLGFHVPGELLGIDAIGEGRHPSDATVIEESLVCEFPYAALEAQMREAPALQRRLLRLMSLEIAREEELMCVLGQRGAESRLANCLLDLSKRQQKIERRGDWFRLSMSREDLGNHLGLAMETVSRLFSRFQEEGLLSVAGRQVRLLDYPRLRAVQESGGGFTPVQGAGAAATPQRRLWMSRAQVKGGDWLSVSDSA